MAEFRPSTRDQEYQVIYGNVRSLGQRSNSKLQNKTISQDWGHQQQESIFTPLSGGGWPTKLISGEHHYFSDSQSLTTTIEKPKMHLQQHQTS